MHTRHVYIHTYTEIYTYIYIQAQTCTHRYTDTQRHAHDTQACTYTHIQRHMHIHTHTRTGTHTCMVPKHYPPSSAHHTAANPSKSRVCSQSPKFSDGDLNTRGHVWPVAKCGQKGKLWHLRKTPNVGCAWWTVRGSDSFWSRKQYNLMGALGADVHSWL